jgi:hypothetical protein
MLARAVMPVLIVLIQSIRSGTGNGDGGERDVKGPGILKVPQRRAMQNMPG